MRRIGTGASEKKSFENVDDGRRIPLYTKSSPMSLRLRELTGSPKGNDAHLRAIIQSEKKWKHQSFRRLRAANSVVRGRIWPNFKLIQALIVIITCKYEKDPVKNNREPEGQWSCKRSPDYFQSITTTVKQVAQRATMFT